MNDTSTRRQRRYVLGGVFIGFLVLAGVMLAGVMETVFFALTVGYLLAPVRSFVSRRGVPNRIAAALTALLAFLVTVLLFAPIAIVVFVRLELVLKTLSNLPETLDVGFGPFAYTIVLADVIEMVVGWLSDAGTSLVGAAPVLLLQAALFVFLVYSILANRRSIQSTLTAVVPPQYRDLTDSLHERARRTLFGLYVIQAATAFGTFLIALPFLFGIGYDAPFALATTAGILQFVPVIGPSVLVVGLTVYHVAVGEILRAGIVLIGGGFLIALLPDLLIRPRLAVETAELPGSLYFIGFVGGVLTLGAIGVIAGPLIVALVIESGSQLAAVFENGTQTVSEA